MDKKATILIIDKEKILVDLLIRALTSAEVAVIGTTSAEQGARLVDLHAPDLVVIDPSIENGIPLISSVRSGPIKADVVAVTSSQELQTRVRALGVQTTADRNAGLDTLVEAIRRSLPSSFSIMGADNRVSILIVDDEDELRALLSEYLSNHGYAVTTAKNGREALERLEAAPKTQIVLLDVSMPVMGGMEALRQIMGANPHPNVIMMTAVADREIARQAMKIGAFDYIVKPFDFAAIDSSLRACLSYTEYQKQPWWKRLTRG